MVRHPALAAILLLSSCSPQATVPAVAGLPVAVEPAPAQEQTAPARDRSPASPFVVPKVVHTTVRGIVLTAVVFDDRTHRLAVVDQPGGPGSKWSDAKGAAISQGGLAALNGGFFTPEGEPLGLVIADGRKAGSINRESSLGAGLFVDDGSPALVRRGRGNAAPMALQSGPFLVESHRRVNGLSQRSATARSMIGWDGGHGWFIARTTACSLADLGSAMAGAEIGGIRADTVLNLDGGRSSELWVAPSLRSGPLHQRPFWNKPVRNFLVLLSRS